MAWRWSWVATAVMILAAAGSAATLQVGPSAGGLQLADDRPIGQVTIGAWDASWQYTSLSSATDRTGSLPGTRTTALKLPGAAAGVATVTETLAARDGYQQYTVEAKFSESCELNAFAVQLDLPLGRFKGTTIRSVRGGTLDLTETAFGGTLAAPLAIDLGGGQALYFGPTAAAGIEILDGRGWGGSSAALRCVLISGRIPAGAVVRRSFVMAAMPASQAAAMADKVAPTVSYDTAQPALLLNDDGTIDRLGPGSKRLGSIGLAVHGREWSFTTQGDQVGIHGDQDADSRWFSGSLAVPRTADGQIAFQETVQRNADGTMSLTYALDRATALPLNSHQLSWSVPISLGQGRTIELVGEPGTKLVVPEQLDVLHIARAKVTQIRLWPDEPTGMVIDVAPPTGVLLQDNRQFGSDNLELRFEFGGDLNQPLPAGKVDLALTVRPTTAHQVILSTAGVTTQSDQASWAAYTLPWDDAPIDLSFLNDEYAGVHGFLTRQGDRFVFEDGTEARFWGTCFSAAANFPTHEQADKIAKRLAKCGVNIVRTHHADANWADPDFFRIGDDKAPLGQFHPESIDRFDYLLSRLKAAGVYIYLDQLVHRKFEAGEGVDAADQLENAAKPYNNFDPRLIELQQQFSRMLLNHVNPYTKLAYKDDPAVVLMEFCNENDLMTQPVELEPYRTRLEERYLKWCAAKGLTPEPKPVRFDISKTSILAFLVEVQTDFYRLMTKFFREELGVKVPLTGSNWSRNAGLLTALQVMDYTDSHAYHDHPARDGTFRNQSTVGRASSMMSSLSFNQLVGKPFFVSEWDTPWPNEWRAELPLWLAGTAAFGGWDGLTVYTYRHSASVPIDTLSGSFETFNDPARFGLFPAAALIYRRGDVSVANQQVTVKIPAERAVTAPSPSVWNTPALTRLPETHRTAVSVNDEAAGQVVDFEAKPMDATETIVSDTGELSRHLGDQGYGTIDTPRSQAAYGFLGEAGEIGLSAVTLKVTTPYATVAVSSLTDAPIAQAERLLLTTVGRAENTGFTYDLFRNKAIDRGRGPILIEPIEGTVSVALPQRAWQVIPIAADGSRRQTLATKYVAGRLSFALPGDTIYCVIE